MFEYILVAMVFVDLQFERGDFREHDVCQPGFHQGFDACSRTVGQQCLDQFVAHALRGDDADTIGHVVHRLGSFRFDAESELRHESHRTHHAQRIVVKRLTRVDRRAQYAFGQIVGAAEGVDEFQFRHAQCHGVHSEVSA